MVDRLSDNSCMIGGKRYTNWIACLAIAATVLVGWCGSSGAPATETTQTDAAKPPQEQSALDCLLGAKTLTNDWFGFGGRMADAGVKVRLCVTQVYQMNLHGGLSTHRRSGRYAGRYELTATLDLAKLLGIQGASVVSEARGGWSDGLDDSSIGSAVGNVNDLAMGYYSIYLAKLYYQQVLLDGRVKFRVGKMKLTGGFDCRERKGSFDGSAFANDERTQFLNSALKNNPTIPFPTYGLGAILHVEPAKWWYAAIGAADAQADKRETGFDTTFHSEDYFFSILETGLVATADSANGPLHGTYRVGCWHEGEEKDKHDGGVKRDDMGFYLSFDQMLWKESGQKDTDEQGLGAFARYGFAHGDVNDVRCFWSIGGQYKGLLPSRNRDVLGVGFAQGRLVKAAGFDEPHESVLEIYYNAAVTAWLSVSPSVQYIWHPGGTSDVGNACVVGLRVQMWL